MEVETAAANLPSAPPPGPASPAIEFPSFASTTSKSRKFRRRPAEDDEPTTTNSTNAAAPSPLASPSSSSDAAPNLSEILRLRKKLARTTKGLEATAAPKHTPQAAESERAAAKAATEAELEAVVNRFTHQTGQILDVDKHMMAYIESEMSKRRGAGRTQNTNFGTCGAEAGGAVEAGEVGGGGGSGQESRSAYWTPVVPEGRGATLGKLHEVDLGEEAKKRNIARTQEATRRLQGGEEVEEEEVANSNRKTKNRRRRNSQDAQRDKLVEEVLKESKLEMYTDPDPAEEHRESEGAADDRIAERFRREFLDALMSRRRRRGGDGKKKRDENKKPRGPKLGGSRQARAAMRESQNAAVGSAGGAGKKK